MFPPENTPMEWNMMLNWQPIPIYTVPEASDKVSQATTGRPMNGYSYKSIRRSCARRCPAHAMRRPSGR